MWPQPRSSSAALSSQPDVVSEAIAKAQPNRRAAERSLAPAMHRPLVARQCLVPRRIRGVLNESSVEIRSTVAPPDRSAFTKTTLGSLDSGTCRSEQRPVSRSSACSDGSTSLHQITEESVSLNRLQIRPVSPPQTPVHDDVAAIWRFKHMHLDLRWNSMSALHASHQRRSCQSRKRLCGSI